LDGGLLQELADVVVAEPPDHLEQRRDVQGREVRDGVGEDDALGGQDVDLETCRPVLSRVVLGIRVRKNGSNGK
jgi:hypothetical protein